MKVFSLICACCGAAVEVEESANLYKCSYCGAQQVVEHSGDVISLKKIETLLDDVKVGANRAASGLALQRLLNDIAIIEKSRDQELAQLKAADDQNNVSVKPTPS
ncbi:hypothetical protein [Undibacterium sp. WLX3042]|uniref:hypothetical protein n=1 Tax=Undibacterium sp. WLX3042 TaxID=3412686 RepID=UPI003C2D5EAC